MKNQSLIICLIVSLASCASMVQISKDTDIESYRLFPSPGVLSKDEIEDELDSVYHDFFQNWHNYRLIAESDLSTAKHSGNKRGACQVVNRWTNKMKSMCDNIISRAADLALRICKTADGSHGQCASGDIGSACRSVAEYPEQNCEALEEKESDVPPLRSE